ncbi:MAG TPA: MBL fold metallo-hydrolase [Actinobacteria bacterium]|nr:MBL fold metallo-hydrolase [Actinomycetota bacterium]
MKITIVYDNDIYAKNRGLKSGWGYSCLLEVDDKKVLFDTGWDGEILVSNLNKLDFDVRDIDLIVLSHQHWDHIGGLNHILNENLNIDVWVPKSFSKRLKAEISTKAQLFEVAGRTTQVCENVFTTGELGRTIIEQSLIVKISKGLLVITGCAHPGVKLILERASSIGDVCGLMGGLHDFSQLDLLKKLNLIVASHCTKYKDDISRAFPGSFKEGGVGREIVL